MRVASTFIAAFLFCCAARAQMSIQSLTGPVTQSEINSFKSYMLTQVPPPTPFGIYNATNGDHNEWADFGGGNALESFGLMYEFTGDITILTNMIHWADICVSERNDLLPAANGGQRVMWTNGVAKVWVPNETNSASAGYAGGENGDTKAHILYAALMILQNPSLWNQTVPDGNPLNYGVTYFQRATNYVFRCDEANDNYDYLFITPSNTINNPPDWPSGYHTMFANNIQMMMLGDFQRSAQCHQILGDAPARVAFYNIVVSNAYLQCINGMAGFHPGSTNGYPVYDWAYYPTTKYPSSETENVGHGAYDMLGVWRAYNYGAYNFAKPLVMPFANAEAYVMNVATNSFSGDVDGTGTTQNYMQQQWLMLSDLNPAVWVVTAQADFSSGRYQSTDLMDATMLWMKNRRYQQFSLTPNVLSQTVAIGNGTNFIVSVAALGGFTNNIGLAVSGLPAGANGTFSSSAVNLVALNYPFTNITLSITTSGSTPAGIYPLTITGTNGAVTHSTNVTLVVGNLSLSANPPSQTVSAGSSTSYTITVVTNTGFSGTVSLGAVGLPANTTAGFSPASLSGAGTSTLTITTPASAPSGNYSLTINGTNGAVVAGITVNLAVVGATPVWDGGSTTDSDWSDAANWSSNGLTPNAPLIFSGNARLTNFNDTASATVYSNIVFTPGAGAFMLNGNSITLGGSITNDSANPQTFNLPINFAGSYYLYGASNALDFLSGLDNTIASPGISVLTLAGSGQLSDLWAGGTNQIAMNDPAANWTIVHNPSASAGSIPWYFEINAGTLNFGTAASAPVFTGTTVHNVPKDNQFANTSGASVAFNMVNGTFTLNAPLNTATTGNTTSLVNQVGGTLNLYGSPYYFQGANGGNPGEVSTVTLSGGTMNAASLQNGPFYVASRGNGSLTVSGSGALNCGTLDVSRNASGNTMGSVGVVNLNGGTITCSRVSTATANAQTNWLFGSVATFNFNGGTLRASASSATFYQGNLNLPFLPIASIVKSGGAVIDSSNFSVSVLEPLQHDSTLAGDLDGGLTKLGAGTLTLTAASTFNGDTTVNAGTLQLSGAGSIANSDEIAIAGGATLDASVRTDGTLFLAAGQVLTGSGTVNGNVVDGNGATLAPGGSLSTLTFNNNVMLNGGSTTVFEVSTSPVTNDFAQVAGTLALNGTLFITNVSATPYAPGDSFKLFNAAGFSGAFTNIQPVIPDVNLAWNTNSLTSGILSIVSSPTPQPGISAARMSAGNFILSGSNGVPNWPYIVLTSTNLSLPLNQWTVIATNSFDSSGNFIFTDTPDPTLPQNFYILQMQ